jgi:AcrR family transcriptional regulator
MTARSATAGAKPLRRDAVHNRERLLAAAVSVFAEHGLEAGVEEVARSAGVGVGTLYRRFPSKQALIDELVADMRRELLEAAQAASQCTDGTGLENLLFATGALQSAHRGCLARLWKQSPAGVKAVEEFRGLLVALLDEAQQRGRVRPEITPGDISMMLWSVSSMIETTAGYAPQAWRRHLEVMVAGIRPAGEPVVLREPPLQLPPDATGTSA